MWFLQRSRIPSYEDLLGQIGRDISQTRIDKQNLQRECEANSHDPYFLQYQGLPSLRRIEHEMKAAYKAQQKAEERRNIHAVLDELELGGIDSLSPYFGPSYHIAKAICNEIRLNFND